ncbi:MAG: hypothetical protein IJ730_04110 [Alphaproteobacteria bacterium]|nr:hypothetical protein [Alphaproteobacteria bacterium]
MTETNKGKKNLEILRSLMMFMGYNLVAIKNGSEIFAEDESTKIDKDEKNKKEAVNESK